MNLWGKNTGLFLLIALILFSCGDEVIELGQNLNPNGNNIGIFHTEIPLTSSNVLIDSINTKNTSGSSARFLLGKHFDPDFGMVKATTYTHFLPSKANPNIPNDAIIDSVILSLKENYFYGKQITDFSQDQVVNIYQLSDTIVFNKSYYSFETFPIHAEPLGSALYKTDPNVNETIKVNLPVSDLHYQWLQFANNYTGAASSHEEFFYNVKGIALVPGEDNSVILGLDPYDSASNIIVYYHTPSDASKVESTTFTFLYPYTVSNQRFNLIHSFINIESERSGTPLEGILPHEEFIPGENNPGENNIYMQAGTGIVPKIKIENLNNFLDTAGNIIINQIEILTGEIVPFSKTQEPPNSISYFFTNETNKIVSRSNIFRIPGNQEQSLISTLNKETETYKGVITDYIDSYMRNEIDINEFLLVPSEIGTSFGQAKIPRNNLKLKIYYTKLN